MRSRDYDMEIGNTPMLQFMHAAKARLFVKLEQFNPGGSIKDRIAQFMIEQAEIRGELRPGMAIIESSSGNTAVGLAMIARRKGYRVYSVCDRNVPVAKLARIAALGAHIIYLPPTPRGFDTVELRIAIAERMAAETPDAICTSQFSNPDNPLAHEQTTGPEIWQQSHGELTRVIAAAGTCGTVTGIGRYLKTRNPSVEVRAVEPLGSTIFGGKRGSFLIQGGGLSFTPTILDKAIVDISTHVSDADAIVAAHRFAQETGLLVGGTAGWVLHDLYSLAESAGPDEFIVGVLPDGGDRYLDTIYNPDWLVANGFETPSQRPQIAIERAAATLNCSIDGFEESALDDVASLYRAMSLPVPEDLSASVDPARHRG
jgi:cysteine synthase